MVAGLARKALRRGSKRLRGDALQWSNDGEFIRGRRGIRGDSWAGVVSCGRPVEEACYEKYFARNTAQGLVAVTLKCHRRFIDLGWLPQ
jgi:hypothetical protein